MKKIDQHDFSGSCAPGQHNFFGSMTFSVGIFQWAPKVDGNGLKKSAVKYRIIGPCSNPEIVYKKARRICKLMDAGWIPPTKSTRIFR